MKKYIFALFLITGSLKSYSQERFEAKKLGFSIDVPKEWTSVENEEVLNNLNLYDLTDKQLEELLKFNNSSVDLVTYTKYIPSKVSGIIPTIKIRTNKNETKSPSEFLKFVVSSASGLKNKLTNFRFTENPKLVKISGKDAVSFTVQFTLKYSGIDCKIVSNSYYIPKNGYYIAVNFIEEFNKENNQPLFEQLIKSISLTQ